MPQKKATIKLSNFISLQKKLKKQEDQSRKTRHLLLEHMDITLDEDGSADLEVKQIILNIAGDFDTKPKDLLDKLNLKENLLFGDDEFALLQKLLNKLVKQFKTSASVSSDDIDELDTVGDTVDMVNEKIE